MIRKGAVTLGITHRSSRPTPFASCPSKPMSHLGSCVAIPMATKKTNSIVTTRCCFIPMALPKPRTRSYSGMVSND